MYMGVLPETKTLVFFIALVKYEKNVTHGFPRATIASFPALDIDK